MNTETKKKLLVVEVVEDEPALRTALRDNLSHEHFSVLEADDGEEGLARALTEHPDIILLDIVMPKVNGIDMLRKLREDAWGKNAHVIVLTNYGDNARTADMLELGVTDYLVKANWKIEEVIKKIKEKLRS